MTVRVLRTIEIEYPTLADFEDDYRRWLMQDGTVRVYGERTYRSSVIGPYTVFNEGKELIGD